MTHPELPHNLEAEKATLGSILLNREAIVAVAPWLVPEFFYMERHAQIYEAMLACYNARIPPDTRTVSEELRRRERLDAVGGFAYLSDLVDTVPTSYHVEYYARIVERTALLRKLIQAGGKIASLGYNERDELEETLDKAEQTLFEVSQRRATQDFVPISQVIDQYYEQINYLQEHRGEVVGVPSGFRDLDEITGGLQQSDLIILAARPSVGKCVAAWTLIDDPVSGARLTIEECVRRKLPAVQGIDDFGRVRPAQVAAWIDSGVKPCFRVRTWSGRMLDATGNHPLLTAHGWVKVKQLAVGQSIAVPRALPVFGADESWPLAQVRLLAYLIAEGGLTGSSPGFTNTDPVIVADFKAAVAELFPGCAVRQHAITYYVARPGRGGVPTPNPVYSWLEPLGLKGKLARAKRFPDCVWTWSKRYLAEFVRALMSCDGSIYQVAGLPRIEFTVASQQLAADLHHAFVRFGLVARLYQTKAGAWRVQMTDPDSVYRYQREIGWIGEKAARFAEHTYTLPLRLSNVGHPPQETWELVRQASQQKRLSLSELARRSGETTRTGKYAGYNPHTRRSIPRSRLERYATVLENPQLKQIASPEIFWDPIVAIEPLGEQQVYDLTVPEGSNFIAQDICAHNTSFVLSLAYNIALRNQRTVGIFSLEMSRDQLVQRLLAMDSRIDTHRLRTGHVGETELQTVMSSMARLAAVPIYIEDTPGLTIMEVRSKARRLQSQNGVDIIIIDYLQLMAGKRSENRVQEVSEISRGLKALARELNVPVIALSQLSRAVEGRQSHVPMLSDLRESGCLAGDTLVYLPDQGVYKRIDELVGTSGFHVLAVNTETWQLEPRQVQRAFATGTKSVYRLTTRLGRTIRATANHKFLTINGWRRLDELAAGMRLALPRSLPGPATATMSDAELGLLGHMIGDGCALPRQPIHYTTNDITLAETVARLATEIFGERVQPRIAQERQWYQVYLSAGYRLTHGVRNPIAAWLDQLGIFGLRSYEKFVPAQVFEQPNEGVAAFLRHLWATDGCIHLSEKAKHYANIYYASSSKRLAKDVQALMLRLGINGRLSRHPQPDKGRDQYHVTVSGQTDITRFFQTIGALGTRKTIHQAAIVDYLAGRPANTNRDIIPREIWRMHVVPAMQVAGVTSRQMQAALGNAYCGTGLYKQNLSRERAGRLAQIVQAQELGRLAHSDIYWDEIAAIEPDGEAEVYDLTVEGLHNFVADNIVVHNSIEQDADIVMFIYREELYDPNTDKKGIAELHIAKHRNGPIGVVPMRFDPGTTRFDDLTYRTPEGY